MYQVFLSKKLLWEKMTIILYSPLMCSREILFWRKMSVIMDSPQMYSLEIILCRKMLIIIDYPKIIKHVTYENVNHFTCFNFSHFCFFPRLQAKGNVFLLGLLVAELPAKNYPLFVVSLTSQCIKLTTKQLIDCTLSTCETFVTS